MLLELGLNFQTHSAFSDQAPRREFRLIIPTPRQPPISELNSAKACLIASRSVFPKAVAFAAGSPCAPGDNTTREQTHKRQTIDWFDIRISKIPDWTGNDGSAERINTQTQQTDRTDWGFPILTDKKPDATKVQGVFISENKVISGKMVVGVLEIQSTIQQQCQLKRSCRTASVSQVMTVSQCRLKGSVKGMKAIETNAKRFEQSEFYAVYLELVRVVHSPIYQKQGTFVGAGSRGKISSPAKKKFTRATLAT